MNHGAFLPKSFKSSLSDLPFSFAGSSRSLVPRNVMINRKAATPPNTAIVDLDWVENDQYAQRLVGCQVYLFTYEIVDEEGESEDSPINNYLLTDEDLGEIGTIVHVDDFSGNIVLTVNYKGKDIMIPFSEELVIEIDHSLKFLKLKLPDGLIETN